MKARRPRLPLLPLVLGVTDGLLNALTLAASAILAGGSALSIGLAVRVGCAALVTAAFTMFVADYAERRSALVRASRQLNMRRPGALAGTGLGVRAVRGSAAAMLTAAVSSFLGAALPLALGAVLPGLSPLVLVAAVVALGALGAAIGRLVAGRPVVWAAAMVVGGIGVTLVGFGLHIT